MIADATVRLLVATPDPERASTVTAALEAASDRVETRATAPETVVEALASYDADCVVGEVAAARPLLAALAADRPDLPVVLFYEAVRSSEETSVPGAGGQVAEVVRVPSRAFTASRTDGDGGSSSDDDWVGGLLAGVEAAVDGHDRAWYRSLLDSTTDLIAVLGPDGTFQFLNRTVEPMLGYEPEELVGTSAFDLVHEDDQEFVLQRFYDFAAERGPEHPTETFRVRHADGRWLWVESTGQNRFHGGASEGYVICVREITERREREQELARYETIAETAPFGLFALDEGGVITWANEHYAETLGIPRPELVGTPFLDLVEAGYYDDSVPEEYVGNVRRLLSSENDVEEVSYPVETLRDGERRVHEAHVTLLPLEDGTFRGTVVAYRDVTTRRNYEAELEQQNERLDRFASTVSHDLRNPLSVAKGRTQLARETGDLEHLEHVAAAHERMQSLVEELLGLARGDESVGDPEPVSLASVAEDAWGSIASRSATLEVAGSTTVHADPGRLRQLLENLFRNAVEHGPTDPGSQARQDAVEHGAGEDEPLTVTVGVLADRPGFYVADDGDGVPPADRDRIFEHGYTTAESGTGFGLGIVETVARDHGWTVTLATGEGGARFEVETGGSGGVGSDGDGSDDGDESDDDGEAAPDRPDGHR